MIFARRPMLALIQLSLVLLSCACSSDPISYPYPKYPGPKPHPAPTDTALSHPPPVTIWCWDPWPSGIDPPPAFDVVARFKDRQVSRHGLSDQVAPDDVADLLRQYRKAMQLPRGTRPLAATWQNHGGNSKNRSPRLGTTNGNTYWCERSRTFLNAIRKQGQPLPSVWLFDLETAERKSAPVYDACVWPLLRDLSGDGYVGCDWKGGDNAYGVVLYGNELRENRSRLIEAKEKHPEKEIIPWVPMPGTQTRRGVKDAETVAETVALGAEHGVRRWYLWGDWGHVPQDEARRDWKKMIDAFSAAYGAELFEKTE